MSKHLIASLLILLTNVIFSQEVKTLYFDSSWKLSTKENSVYQRNISLNTDDLSFHGELTDMNNNGIAITQGQYLNNKKEGNFTFRYENGTINRKGQFQNDVPIGVWEFYHPNGELHFKIKLEENDFYFLDLNDQQGISLMSNPLVLWEYSYSNGTGIKGRLSQGVKNGKWELIENGNVIGYELYKQGKHKKTFESLLKRETRNKLISNQIFTPLYLTYSEELIPNNSISQVDYPFLKNLPYYESLGGVGLINGEKITDIESPPLFLGGKERLNQIIKENVRPTEELYGNSGKVFVELHINNNGDAYQVRIVRSENDKLNYEALRIAKLFTGWKPARYQNEPIESAVIIPISLNFKKG